MPDDTPVPPPANDLTPSKINSSNWMRIVGAGFGFLTMVVFLGLGVASAVGWAKFSCSAFSFLAAAFAIGSAMSAAFLGGGAAIEGKLGEANLTNPLRVVVGGGAAMLVVMFVVFMMLRPDDCSGPNDQAGFEIHFDSIPVGMEPKAGREFWVKMGKSSDEQYRNMAVLITKKEDAWISITNSGEVICRFRLLILDDFTDRGEAKFHSRPLDKATATKFNYGLGNNIPGSEVDDCFHKDDDVVSRVLEVSLTKEEFRFARLDTGVLESPSIDAFEVGGAVVPQPQEMQQAVLGDSWFVSAAHAADRTLLAYDKLRPSLASSNDAVRVEARRLLGRNFAFYADLAMKDFLDPKSAWNANLMSSLLHGIIEGTEQAQPNLKAAAGRKLDQELVYLGGNEDYIIELAGHPHEWVRKQARRLMQRYPVNEFGAAFERFNREIQNGCKTEADGWRIYAEAFYQYNRIIQAGLNKAQTNEDVVHWNAVSKRIKDSSEGCLNREDAADLAIIDYGRTLAYGWSKAIDGRFSKSAANDFHDWIKGREVSYYKQSHISRIAGTDS